MADTKSKSSASAERKEQFTTLSGIPIERVYYQDSFVDSETEESIGFPGEYPFTRGIYPTMYAGASGRCGSMRDSAAPSNPTSATGIS